MEVSAVLAALLVYVFCLVVKHRAPQVWKVAPEPIALAIGVAVAFLVRETVWSDSQVFGGHKLGSLDGWSTLVAGLVLGAMAVGIDRAQDTVKNVGQNQPPSLQPPPKSGPSNAGGYLALDTALAAGFLLGVTLGLVVFVH